MHTPLSMRAGIAAVGAAVVAISAGCTPQSTAVAAAVNDRVYSVTPASLKVNAGLLSGEVTDMKVTERVEEGSGRVVSPAKLTGQLVLKNLSTDQALQLLAAKIIYVDAQGHPIKLATGRTEPTLKVASSYGPPERLNPGQKTTQSVDVDFPVEALKARKLKDIRVELEYIPSPLKEAKLSFAVSIGGQ